MGIADAFKPAAGRCPWAVRTELEQNYHDLEWGVPTFEDLKHFEFLVLESAQAGLSWLTILKKRSGYRKCFEGFDPQKVAGFTLDDVSRLLLDESIVRNRSKIESAISNARLFLKVQAKYGSFSNYIWSFVNGKTLHGRWTDLKQIPPVTPEAERLAKDMKAQGFRFLGPTVLYAHMQATGLVNDHLQSCFRYAELKQICKHLNV
jgi:DNA-3-methyladenine glycosylase I